MFISSKSNVGKPGQWMFRIDSAKIEAGGCNTKGKRRPLYIMIIGERRGKVATVFLEKSLLLNFFS